ncbi:MAG: hypothetical protein AAF251_17115 [Pseudomonadota bacterium]
MLLAFSAAIAAQAMPCAPVEAAGQLFDDDVHWIIVGELHGTNEAPDAFANLVCLATRTNRPVTVAVEFSSDWQPAFDLFLASDGGPKAQQDFLELPDWQKDFQDGRTSVAMLRLFETLRRMKQSGAIADVRATDIGQSTPPGLERDAAMADAWQKIAQPDNGLVLALVGNIHAMRVPLTYSGGSVATAGSLMPPAHTVTVNIVGNGGDAWNCTREGCGVSHALPSPKADKGLQFSESADTPWAVTYELGVPTTAALPALQKNAREGD